MRHTICARKGFLMKTIGLLFLLALSISSLNGQATGVISGTVVDSSGAAVPTAAVQIKNVGTGLSRALTSDDQGRYRAPELEIGNYEISASKPGFSSTVRTGVTL